MATIKEVAERAGVSIGTVSNVTSGRGHVSKSRLERVLAAIRELDYHPNEVARSLKVKQTRLLGMVLPDITNPFFSELIRGAEDAALARGYLLLTTNTDEHREREIGNLRALRSRRVDGILLSSTAGKAENYLRSVVSSGTPLVCLDRVVPGLSADTVLTDNVRGMQEITRYLLRIGHRSIALITGPLALQTARERVDGFHAAFNEASLKPLSGLVVEGDFREESGYRLGKQLLLRGKRPTAILTSNGVMMLGVLSALDELAVSCPTEVSLATFDDLPLAHAFHPRLTAVAQPAREIGRHGADLLISRIDRSEIAKPRSIRLTPELLVRESTARPQRQST